jgi:prepilin signal peptidase PulO-like enzyme (type II secretory pathway)
MGLFTPGFDFFELQSPYLELWSAFFGLLVGSFLNVLALRSLSGESLISPFSNCPKCKHRLGVLELIPVVSYFCLGGRCRHCKEKISWHYPLVEIATAGLFAAIVHQFAQPIFASCPEHEITTIAMLIFASVLIAVTVTDFREKLIPHEITYPSIIAGLLFSSWVRHDLLGALAGVGVSYILFDFIAFYGLKVYFWRHPELKEDTPPEETPKDKTKTAETKTAETKTAETKTTEIKKDETKAAGPKTPEIEEIDDEIDRSFGIIRQEAKTLPESATMDEDEEPFEVMGGGDAVLSAVLAAWLGWEKLVVALVIGFMVGAIMGACYLVHELIKQKRIDQVRTPALLGFLIAGGPVALAVIFASNIFHMPETIGKSNSLAN